MILGRRRWRSWLRLCWQIMSWSWQFDAYSRFLWCFQRIKGYEVHYLEKQENRIGKEE
jgi:hypothetical protein